MDEGLLQRMRLLERAEPLDGGDLGAAERADRGDAGADRLAVHQHRAGAALGQPAAELGAVERQVVAQHIEQRGVRLGRHAVARAVDFQIDCHGLGLSLLGRWILWADSAPTVVVWNCPILPRARGRSRPGRSSRW